MDLSARRSSVGAEREKLVATNSELAERQRSLGSLSLAGVLPFAVFVELVWPFVLISMLALKWARSTVRG